METIKVDYLKLAQNTDENTHIKIVVYYDRDSWNARGYYISVSPVKREDCGGYISEQYHAFSGYKQLLLEVARKSKKAETQALAKAEELQDTMIERVLLENEYALA